LIGDRIEVVIPNSTRYLGTVRDLFRSMARDCSEVFLRDRDVAELQLVLQEACINAIRHGRPRGAGGSLRVVFVFHPDRLVIEVHDGGPGFDPDSVPDPDPENLQEGGYGVYIMKQSMDLVEARRDARGFVLSMTKHLEPATSGSGAGRI